MDQSEKEAQKQPNAAEFSGLAVMLSELGRGFYSRGWALGTSGNFSAVSSREPLRLAITSSGIDKGKLAPGDILEVDEGGQVVQGAGRPSAETLLHLAVVKLTGAGAVLHTHSVWSNILSDAHMGEGGIHIEGYEMLKGLDGVTTHEHSEWLPVVENSQDMRALARSSEEMLNQRPRPHGFLVRRHGLYTWGRDLAEAKRHVEILEFLLEVLGRTYCAGPR
ncbi:MAG TPA: methylthioribulose 1-phosphate dehydratase [Blastocatellia bacterium]|jgi:methylthioribulose-1-phosphate dehydratase|nr:methylthioribulose 1-phosphate dehydratase [Blastocatellia bacterium]